MKVVSRSLHKFSLAISISLHAIIVLLLIISFDKTIRVSAPRASTQVEQKPIIDAVMVSKKSLQEEVQRLEQKEIKKRQQEENRLKEIAQKEQEAKQKLEKEHALAIELKKKNELLKKEAELKQLAEEKREKEQQAKLKKEQEALKKVQKEKEEAIKKAELEKKALEQREKELAEQQAKDLAAKQAKEAVQKAQELAAPGRQISQQEANRFAALIRSKIHQNWRKPIGFDYEGLSCVVNVSLLPTGEVVQAVVVKSSGSLEYDRSAELAVKKASPLPMPEDSNLAKEFRQFTFTFSEAV